MAQPDETTILLAEDRDDDVVLIQRAFKRTGFPCRLMVTRDGEETVRYLSGAGQFADRNPYPLPALLLLDLKLPTIDGFEILRWIKARPELKDLPVIVLTLSNRIRDVNNAYALGAYSFLIKTTDFEDAAAFAQSLTWYWANIKKNRALNMPPPNWPRREDLSPNSGTPSYPEPQKPST